MATYRRLTLNRHFVGLNFPAHTLVKCIAPCQYGTIWTFVTGPKIFKICKGLEIPLLGSYFRYIGS
jgi:hypothetical protein